MPKATAHVHGKFVASLHENLSDGSANGASVDTLGFDEALVIVSVGVFGGTSPSLTVNVEEDSSGSTMSAAAAVAGTTMTAQLTGGVGKEVVGRLNLVNRGRYLRAVSVISGTSPTGEYLVGFLLTAASEVPVSQVNTVEYDLDT